MPMKQTLITALVLLTGSLLATSAPADTLAYPSPDAPSFMIDYPASWEMTPGEEVGDYTSLIGTSGTSLMFRTVTAEDLKQAVKSSIEYVYENYTDVALAEPQESKHRDLDGFVVSGAATDSETGKMRIGMAWFQLKDGTIGEIWFSAPEEDAEGIEEAKAVIGSFRAPD